MTPEENGAVFGSSDDEFEFDEEYFDRTYRPLSNLPTPPPSTWDASDSCGSRAILEDGELLGSALLGPAVHLVNLIPPAASLTSASVPAVHALLARASLPLETIALAVCILDSLDSKFSLNWRLVCPLVPLDSPPPAYPKRHTLPATASASDQPHIDSVRPELIIVASLVIAVKFVDDCPRPTRYYGSRWGRDVWTCDQINATERCIMESLGHRILPLWDPELIGDALADMGRAAKQQAVAALPADDDVAGMRWFGIEDQQQHKRTMSSGPGPSVAAAGHASSHYHHHHQFYDDGGNSLRFQQPTPAETPESEDPLCEPAAPAVGDDVRAAFLRASATAPFTRDSLRPPPRGKRRAAHSPADDDILS